jgi:hypothetical protein
MNARLPERVDLATIAAAVGRHPHTAIRMGEEVRS